MIRLAYTPLIAGLALVCHSAASANPISFVPNGDNNAGVVKCEVPVSSLGSVSLKNGLANISGRVISIKSSSDLSESPRTVLVGSVLRAETNLTSEPPSIAGLALFLMGDWSGLIDDGKAQDTIFRKDGHIVGRILGMEGDNISIGLAGGKQQSVPISTVLYIRSPRVFVFKLALKSKQPLQKDSEFQAEAVSASFRPTETARTLSGSVIPQSQKPDDLGIGPAPFTPFPGTANGPANVNGMGALNAPGALPGLGGFNAMGAMGGISSPSALSGMHTAVPNQKDNSFDGGAEAEKFSTVQTRWGKQKLTLPPGILD